MLLVLTRSGSGSGSGPRCKLHSSYTAVQTPRPCPVLALCYKNLDHNQNLTGDSRVLWISRPAHGSHWYHGRLPGLTAVSWLSRAPYGRLTGLTGLMDLTAGPRVSPISPPSPARLAGLTHLTANSPVSPPSPGSHGSYGFPAGFLRASCGLPAGLLWLSYHSRTAFLTSFLPVSYPFHTALLPRSLPVSYRFPARFLRVRLSYAFATAFLPVLRASPFLRLSYAFATRFLPVSHAFPMGDPLMDDHLLTDHALTNRGLLRHSHGFPTGFLRCFWFSVQASFLAHRDASFPSSAPPCKLPVSCTAVHNSAQFLPCPTKILTLT